MIGGSTGRLRSVFLGAVLLLVVGPGCAVRGGAARSTQADPVRPGAPRLHSSLTWKSCDQGSECTTLRVPLDYAKPRGPTLTLGIARQRAGKPTERIGPLLVNPGGPGGSSVDLAEAGLLPSAVTDRFDIVGVDPRGVGRSSPLECHSNLQEMYDADPTIEDSADRANYLAVSRSYVDECRRKYAAILPFLGTQNVARDMDQVRKALGEEQISFVGYSYGTSIGQQYAQLFPQRIRAMVLDGVVDTEVTGVQGAAKQADGFERTLDAFIADCAGRSSCKLGQDPGSVVDRVIADAERQPIPAASASRPATPGVVQLGISQALYSKDQWPELASALDDAAKGDGSGLVTLADEYLDRRPDGSYPNRSEIYFAVSCLDSAWPRDPDTILAAAKATGRRDRRLGEGLVNDYLRCALWPARPRPLPKLTAGGSPAIVVVSTTGDPATPYASGVAVAERLPKGVLLTNVGESHTAYSQGKACIDDAVDTYLVELRPPKDGLRCE